MSWLQRSVRHDLFYAGLGLACALLLVGLPVYLALPLGLAPLKVQSAPVGLEVKVSNPLLGESVADDVLFVKLLAAEPEDAGAAWLNAPSNSICIAETTVSGIHADLAEDWPAPGEAGP